MPKRRRKNYMTERDLLQTFPGLTKKLIKKHLPAPQFGLVPNEPYKPAWPKNETVRKLRANKEVMNVVQQSEARREKERVRREEINTFMAQFTPDALFRRARQLNRRFILHIGPTNSGKTYQALEALKTARLGVYLGPLRLLALEVSDKLNAAGKPCSLLTGEECIPVPDAGITASTIEMCDFMPRYDAAVIDEAQMIVDPNRGSHWLSAICRVNAAEIHVCLAAEAEEMIESIILGFGAPYTKVRHERLTPLILGEHVGGYNDIRPGDAVIAFSRKNVLGIAGSLEKRGIKASVIYGSLPPDVRRSEVRKYAAGETSVVVATDAIGMGISLPIKRVVFTALQKYDGVHTRMLTESEVLQIAGRAGRYGIFDIGEVSSTCERRYLKHALQTIPEPGKKFRVAFPKDAALESNYSFRDLIEAWQALPKETGYAREDMSDALILLTAAGKKRLYLTREQLLTAITCPVDTGDTELVRYWLRCLEAIDDDRLLPIPDFETETLEGCEQQYHALDVYHIMAHRFDQEDISGDIREETGARITELLQETKAERAMKCVVCGRELPLAATGNICAVCRRQSRMRY